MIYFVESGAPVAQWTERRPSKPMDGGSNPSGRTTFQGVA